MSRIREMDPLTRYTAASEAAAATMIASYSTSFALATKMLGARHRNHIRNVYALVRIADELVDGVASQANVAPASQLDQLGELEAETEQAIATGYSSNPIVHAFAYTARAAGIDSCLTRPFFASMRMDLPQQVSSSVSYTEAAHSAYVYGSAEVVGLMCLRVFIREEQLSPHEMSMLEHGARQLGAAFQNVNFLRDLGDDTERLGRDYLGGGTEFTAELQQRWVATIRRELAAAAATIGLLPRDSRAAVECALRLFARLTDELERTSAIDIRERRVRVSNPTKAWLALQSIIATRKMETK